jgi:hypothetical protein
MRETSASEPLRTHRKSLEDIETGGFLCPGKSMAETYLLVMRCPVYRWRESHPGFRMELENLAGDGKGKSTSGKNREAESTNARARGGLLRNSGEAG